MKVPKDKMRKWIKALRSGKFKQGSRYLQMGGKYCCLGVACRVLVPGYEKENGAIAGALPQPSRGAPGWLVRVNKDVGGKIGESLTDMNDDVGADHRNFNEIADILQLLYIEKALD